MIANQVVLLKREVWEHSTIYVTPLVIAVLVTLFAITGQVTISAFGAGVDVALHGITSLSEGGRSAILATLMIGVSSLFALAMCVLITFYSLDALYAERRDRSILFWRSMPCTDAETVLSKLLTASVVIPLVTCAAIVATHLVVLTCASVWVGMRGANAWHLIWAAAPLLDNWTATALFLVALPLWLAPFIGWFLFVSAFTNRSPFLVALLPIAILPMLEKSLVGTSLFADAFFARSTELPLFHGMDASHFPFFGGEGPSVPPGEFLTLLSQLDLAGFLASPGLWLGLVVCGLFTTAAIYVRRYRDDS